MTAFSRHSFYVLHPYGIERVIISFGIEFFKVYLIKNPYFKVLKYMLFVEDDVVIAGNEDVNVSQMKDSLGMKTG